MVNSNGEEDVSVMFGHVVYKLPAKSISVLPDCKHVVFNTGVVSTQYGRRIKSVVKKFDRFEMWEEFKEPVLEYKDASFKSVLLLEHMSVAKDVSDYLWYTFRYISNEILL